MTNIHFISLGCPKNLVDSEVMLGQLTAKGYTLTNDSSKAEVIVVNTCAFVEDAKREAIDTILEMAEQKKGGVGFMWSASSISTTMKRPDSILPQDI